MRVRNIQQLRRAQQQLLEEYRQERAQARASGPTGSPAEVTSSWIGRVSSVVSSDPQRGPHLLVIKQTFSGAPPAPSDALSSAQVYYPAPNRQVSDYAVNEYVVLLPVDGANLAAKLA